MEAGAAAVVKREAAASGGESQGEESEEEADDWDEEDEGNVFPWQKVPGNPFVEFAPPSNVSPWLGQIVPGNPTNVSHGEAISHDAHYCNEKVLEGELAGEYNEKLLCLSYSLGWGGRYFDVKACRRAENIKGGRPFKTLVCI